MTWQSGVEKFNAFVTVSMSRSGRYYIDSQFVSENADESACHHQCAIRELEARDVCISSFKLGRLSNISHRVCARLISVCALIEAFADPRTFIVAIVSPSAGLGHRCPFASYSSGAVLCGDRDVEKSVGDEL